MALSIMTEAVEVLSLFLLANQKTKQKSIIGRVFKMYIFQKHDKGIV